ncbi:MAG: GNAT family N-acetyltransferase [Pseudobdellovibrionaceae bacterium]|nr:GNAT family N-acetyltransferase [Bdellovibrionales bacterium]USN47922.1 MAG: GNAT family N-acetyltransferase [Pseudobdellovibrionaceae bacterium]
MSQLNFKAVDSVEFWRMVQPHFKRVFEHRRSRFPDPFYSDLEKERLKTLQANLDGRYSLHVLAYQSDQLVGWHVGEQEAADTYYMRNSAVLEEYRGKSFYEQILGHVLNVVVAEGFQVISSIHHPNNPAVLIPKLRKGFIITATEMSDLFGFLVRMKYFANEDRKKSFFERIGLTF